MQLVSTLLKNLFNEYALGSLSIINHLPGIDINIAQFVITLTMFYSGWVLTRGANMQKYLFKQDPESTTCFNGLVRQDTISGSKILCSGFWGLSRHINYMGEIVQAIALALPGSYVSLCSPFQLTYSNRSIVSGSPIPWLYPLYYILLFVTRQIDDDKICLAKYGASWKEYMERVPYRIVPYVW